MAYEVGLNFDPDARPFTREAVERELERREKAVR